MATSQFKIYMHTDLGAPQMTGTTGSMITLLDACLVDGYDGHPAAGWLKPVDNDGLGKGCWQQPSGSRCCLYVNDSGFVSSGNSGTSGARECFACGFEQIVNITSSRFAMPYGSGQFPTYDLMYDQSSQNQSGSTIWRKSNTADSTTYRPWIMFADAYTFYLFVQHDSTYYTGCLFGDVFSLKTTPDYYKCFIQGRVTSTTTVTSQYDVTDVITSPTSVQFANLWLARSYGGSGSGIRAAKVGDAGKTAIGTMTGNNGSPYAASVTYGVIPLANGTDSGIYISPIWISEVSSGTLRGRIRGMYHLCHSISSFGNGQLIQGGNEYVGKTFQVLKGLGNGGGLLIEVSNTVETNALP